MEAGTKKGEPPASAGGTKVEANAASTPPAQAAGSALCGKGGWGDVAEATING